MDSLRGFILGLLLLKPALASSPRKVTISRLLTHHPQLQTQVWASVGEYLYDVDGYTTPGATVKLISSQKTLEATTISDSRGHFTFHHLLSRRQPGMFCFFQNYQGKTSPPLCLWPPPADRQRHLRGVLLPPIISLQLSQLPGQSTYLLGKTIPHSQISLLKFQNHHWWHFLLFRLPISWAQQTIQADRQGSFRIDLGKTGWGQVIVGSRFQQSLTPPSYNLTWRGWSISTWIHQQIGGCCHRFCHWSFFWFLELIVLAYLLLHASQQPN